MKKIYLLMLCIIITSSFAFSQTWTGATNTDWNTATNWSPATVPLSTENVIIPGSVISNNWPVFASNVTINGINMQNGSRLDVNGFSLSISSAGNYNYFIGSTINNSNSASDVVFNINTGSFGYETYFRSNTVNDDIVFNLSGTNTFYEGDAVLINTFNGNVTFNAAFTGNLFLSHASATQYSGNLTVNRTMTGYTQAFFSGGTVSGNFSFSNSTGGNLYLGNNSIRTAIGGTVNISVNNPSTYTFQMRRLINQASGGAVTVSNTLGFDVHMDTLMVTSLSLTGYRGNAYGNFFNNSITGNVTLEDDVTYNTTYETYLRNNTITGTADFTLRGSNALQEADAANSGNRFGGNVTVSVLSAAVLNMGIGDTSVYSGNLVISRTAAGSTNLFNSGADISGNFSLTNNAGGLHTIGSNAGRTTIAGTLNIAVANPTPFTFDMRRIINQTGGGSVNIQNTTGIDIDKDTLLLNTFSVTGYRGMAYANILNNKITGNVTIADDASYAAGYETYLRSNIFNGNTNITINGTNALQEADAGGSGNQFSGNVTITANAGGGINFSNGDTSSVSGNLSITRIVTGTTTLFNSGAIIAGNFSFSAASSGNNYFGNLGVLTSIAGTVNISVNYPTPATFRMYRLGNQTGGGSVNIQNSLGFDVQKDSLMLASLSLTGYRGGAYGYFYNNSITGSVNISDDVSFAGGYAVYLYSNVITGNSVFTTNGPNTMYDADAVARGNKYIGNVSYIQNGGPISIALGSYNEISQNLTLNSASGITLNKIRFNGSTNGVIDQLGSQPIIIPELEMAKTGTGKLTLNDPVTVSFTAAFNGGNIQASTPTPLIFNDNAVYSGGNAASHVMGQVVKIGNDAFVFPTGTATSFNTVAMAAPVDVADRFSAEYFKANPNSAGYNTSLKAASLNKISSCEYWDVKREIGASNVVLTFSFDNPCAGTSGYITDPSAMRVAHWNSALWEDLGNGGSTGSLTGTITTAAAVSAFGPFTFASVDLALNPLPLTLVSFTAQQKGAQSLLQWKTENEINFSHFEIEKSNNNNNYAKMGQAAAGNQTGNYSIFDPTPANGANFYRLKMVDVNGRFTYSAVLKLIFSGHNIISLSPNPAKDFVTINNADQNATIKIMDIRGRVIMAGSVKSNNTINISALPVGMYMLQTISNGKTESVTFIKD